MVERLFLAVPRGCLRFVIVVFPDHTHLLFLLMALSSSHVILSKSWFTGVEKLKFDSKLLTNSEICFFLPLPS